MKRDSLAKPVDISFSPAYTRGCTKRPEEPIYTDGLLRLVGPFQPETAGRCYSIHHNALLGMRLFACCIIAARSDRFRTKTLYKDRIIANQVDAIVWELLDIALRKPSLANA